MQVNKILVDFLKLEHFINICDNNPANYIHFLALPQDVLIFLYW